MKLALEIALTLMIILNWSDTSMLIVLILGAVDIVVTISLAVIQEEEKLRYWDPKIERCRREI